MSYAGEFSRGSIRAHSECRRLYAISIRPGAVKEFIVGLADVGTQRLSYVPYMRLVLAERLLKLLGAEMVAAINGILRDRASGGFTMDIDPSLGQENFIRWATAVTHLAGLPNFDAMSSNYFATFAVKDVDNSDSYLRQAYRLFTMHTDGTFVDEACDWLLMMKMEEANAVGGRSRLLHLDDWEELRTFMEHPCAMQEIEYRSPPSKNTSKVVYRTTFFEHEGRPCVCFIDQFANPRNTQQAGYLNELSESMERSKSVLALELPVGGLVMLNNLFWLHGREAFVKHAALNRVLMRIRGKFLPTLDATRQVDRASTAHMKIRGETVAVGASH